MSDFKPDLASPPGDTIVDIMEERKLSLIDLARMIGISPDDCSHLLGGRLPITPTIACRLSANLHSTPSFWMTRELHYRQALAKKKFWQDFRLVAKVVTLGAIVIVLVACGVIALVLRFVR